MVLILAVNAWSSARGQDFAFNYHTDFPKILAQTTDSTGPLYYDKLFVRFRVNDTTLTDFEVLALLIGFTARPAYTPYNPEEFRIHQLDVYQHAEAVRALADSLLLRQPFNTTALWYRALALNRMKQHHAADRARWKFDRIMRAMAGTGDGLTPETAIFTLDMGFDYLTYYLGGSSPSIGTVTNQFGDYVDIEGYVPKGAPYGTAPVPMYFQAQHVYDYYSVRGQREHETREAHERQHKEEPKP
jgi:uncharacterized protein DUF4919